MYFGPLIHDDSAFTAQLNQMLTVQASLFAIPYAQRNPVFQNKYGRLSFSTSFGKNRKRFLSLFKRINDFLMDQKWIYRVCWV